MHPGPEHVGKRYRFGTRIPRNIAEASPHAQFCSQLFYLGWRTRSSQPVKNRDLIEEIDEMQDLLYVGVWSDDMRLSSILFRSDLNMLTRIRGFTATKWPTNWPNRGLKEVTVEVGLIRMFQLLCLASLLLILCNFIFVVLCCFWFCDLSVFLFLLYILEVILLTIGVLIDHELLYCWFWVGCCWF